jgi:small subunit ribosomal protein SAe
MKRFIWHFSGQVDLFFYREPEEAKQQEEEDALPAADYALPPPDYGISAGEWGSTIADTQWTTDVAQQPIPAANFFPEQGNHNSLRLL